MQFLWMFSYFFLPHQITNHHEPKITDVKSKPILVTGEAHAWYTVKVKYGIGIKILQ